MLRGIFYLQIIESSSLVSVLFREVFSHPYISFFHLLVNVFSVILYLVITPHAQHVRGKVIGCGVHICLWTKKIFESYFRDRLTFSNIRSRTSRRIYRLALPLHTPETLSSLSKSRISIFNAHLTLFVHRNVAQFHR